MAGSWKSELVCRATATATATRVDVVGNKVRRRWTLDTERKGVELWFVDMETQPAKKTEACGLPNLTRSWRSWRAGVVWLDDGHGG